MFFNRALKLYLEEDSPPSVTPDQILLSAYLGPSNAPKPRPPPTPEIAKAKQDAHNAYVQRMDQMASEAASRGQPFDRTTKEAIEEATKASTEAYNQSIDEQRNASIAANSNNASNAANQALLLEEEVYLAPDKIQEIDKKIADKQKELEKTQRQYAEQEPDLRKKVQDRIFTEQMYSDSINAQNVTLGNIQKQIFALQDEKAKLLGKLKQDKKTLASIRRPRGDSRQSKINKFKGTRTRLTDQAALIINFEKIAQQKHIIKDGTKKTKSATKEELCRFDTKYNNFSLARLGTTGHYAITSLITKHSSMNVFFNKLPPQVLSLLIPTIKLYKVFYPKIEEELKKDDNTSVMPKTSFDWRVPFDDVPVKYFDQTSKNAPLSVDEILNGNGSLHAVGIKSFTYKYEGNNPATANTLLSAELKLFFENPEELIKEYKFTGPNNKEYTFQYSDLVNQASKRITTGAKKNAPNENYYRIKIICGFTDINENIITKILSRSHTNDQIQSIIEAIKVSKVTFYLSPYSYDINFTENSSAELSIKYTAAVDAIMISEEADIFNSSVASQLAIKARKEFELFKAAERAAPEILKNPSSKTCPEEEENQYLKLFLKNAKGSNFKTIEEYLKLKVFNTKKEAYKNIYRRLIGLEKSTNILSGLYSAKIKTDLINALTVVGNSEERGKEILKNQKVIDITFINVKNLPSITKFIDNLKYQTASKKGNSNNPTMDEQVKKAIDNIHKQNMANAGGGYSTIKFFFLGDIIDAALECFNNIENPYDKPRLILGEIPILIPTNWDDKGRTHKYTKIFANLADIPISFDFFMQFFVDKIIKTQRERYSAMEFIKDIISTLVIPAVSPSIFGIKESPNTRVKYSLLTFNVNTIIKDGKEVDPFTNAPIEEKKTYLFYDESEKLKKNITIDNSVLKDYTIDIKQREYVNKLISTAKDSKNNPSVLTYLYVYCSSKFPNQFIGDESEDIKYGVYHVSMGRDSGIIKKINFKKSDMPFQREFLARRQGSGKGTTIKQVYNADITMFGNNIYVPGDYIFIEPYYLTRSKATIDLQNDLGLGGYYMVLKVHNNISESSFETRLECIFQAPVIKNSKGERTVDPIDEDACN